MSASDVLAIIAATVVAMLVAGLAVVLVALTRTLRDFRASVTAFQTEALTILDDARQSMEALLAPEVVETEIGALTIKGVFRTMKDQIIAGGEITNGKAMPNILARVKRGDEQIAEVEVMSVQRQQQEAKEVFEGEMCGLSLKTEKKLLIEEGDKLEFFTRELVKRTLS